MIDCTTVDLGRDIGLMEQVSRASGVNSKWRPTQVLQIQAIIVLTFF